ncbi:N-acetyltransferase eso1 [Pyrenophora seminiperda CCB06]|uniref:N-acetyltransferase eso1 n=1 Tax=Pyrenophora seminiperda CCB06 TaxID=1302712 RepID=A0A3M7MEB7_9PLEO|nr:N-acetyltransferase eso1 [Pyrenophora seminiperda CCB06]
MPVNPYIGLINGLYIFRQLTIPQITLLLLHAARLSSYSFAFLIYSFTHTHLYFVLSNMVALTSLLPVFVAFIAVATGQQCYGVDGFALDSTFMPCNPSAKHSGCCASTDLCLSNGLCMATTDVYIGMIFSRGCTDSTGQDVACPQLCPGQPTKFNGTMPVSEWQLQTCNVGQYCCRAANDQRSCCNNSTAPKVTATLDVTLQLPNSSAASKSEDVEAPAITSVLSQATSTPPADTCNTTKHHLAIAITIGGVLLGTIIAGLAAAMFWIYKEEKRQRKLKEHYESQFSQTNAYRKALQSSVGVTHGDDFMEDIKVKCSGPD